MAVKWLETRENTGFTKRATVANERCLLTFSTMKWRQARRESSEIFIIFTRQTKGWTGGKKDRTDRECNNEANIKRKNASGCAKGPLLTHLINMFIAPVTSVYRLSGSSDVTGASLTSCHDKTKPWLSDRGKIIARYRPRKARCIPTPCPTMYSRFYLRSASRLFLTKTNKVGGGKRTTKPPSDDFFDAECKVCRAESEWECSIYYRPSPL